MKEGIHPNYDTATVRCACGETFKCGTTKPGDVMTIDVCNKCHP